jgi:predicted Fe-S protein YdhL (DUF1289 family)
MPQLPHDEHPPSPCIQVCRSDPASGICRGCLRTLDEIAGWPNSTGAEKRAVLDRVHERRTGVKRAAAVP